MTVYVPAARPLMLDAIEPVFHLYEYGALPPLTDVSVIVPFGFVQMGLLMLPLIAMVETKLPTLAVIEFSQPLASVTDTTYGPGVRPEIDDVVWLFAHAYVNGATLALLVTATLAAPLPEPHVSGVVRVDSVSGLIYAVTENVCAAVHELASVTVTL